MGKGRDRRKKRRATRRESKRTRRDDRRSYKLEKKTMKQESKNVRVAERQDTKRTAYENGIDPNAWIADTAASAAQGVSAAMTGGARPSRGPMSGMIGKDGGGGQVVTTTKPPMDMKMIMMLGAAALGLFLFMKK